MIDIKKYVKVKSGSQDMVLDQVLENGNAHEAVINPLNITPSKSAQVFTPPQGIDGYAPVSVSAVTASIDENIVSGNIKSGVNILGVEGNYAGGDAVIDSISITPTTSEQVISATGGVDGYSPITVEAVTSSIDANITDGNIKSGVTILGVTGNVVELQGEERTVSITSSAGETITPSSGKNGITSITVTPALETTTATPMTFSYTLAPSSNKCGFSSVTVSAVTASIDSNITSGNIKSGVSILGVNGSVVELNGSTASVTPTTSQQTITPTSPSNGLTSVTVDAVTSSIDSNIQAGNIKQGVSILGVTGTAKLAPAYYSEKVNDNGTLKCSSNGINTLSGITAIDDYVLSGNCYGVQTSFVVPDFSSIISVGYSSLNRTFQNSSATGSVNLSSLTTFTSTYSFYYAFANSSISSVNLSALTTLTTAYVLEYMCYQTTTLTSINLHNLQTINELYVCYSMCSGCTGLTSIDLSSLTSIGGYYSCGFAFNGCTSLTSVDLSSLTTIIEGQQGSQTTQKGYACYCMFQNCSNLTSVDLSSLNSIRGQYTCYKMFFNCTSLTSVDLSSLTYLYDNLVAGYMFDGCTSLTTINLENLQTLGGQNGGSHMFNGCTSLSSVNLSSLDPQNQTVNPLQYMFGGCTSLTSITFDSLGRWNQIPYGYLGNMFNGCTNLTNLYFPSVRAEKIIYYTTAANDSFGNMLSGVTGCTVHFPANIQTGMEASLAFANGFGGTNTVVLFDLINTIPLNGANNKTYLRTAKYDTQTAAAWATFANEIVYTPSRTTNPQVGDTLYSDSACTVAVTTIDSIA